MAELIPVKQRPGGGLSRNCRTLIRRFAWARGSAVREEFVRLLAGALADVALEFGEAAAGDPDEIERAVVECLEKMIEARS